MNGDRPIRVLVDLTGLVASGQGGGIKPVLFAMLRWLATHGAERLHFIYVANAATAADVRALARNTDILIDAAKASAETAALLDCDLVYCPFGVTDLACPGIPTITLVVDLLHRDFPATLRDPDRLYREKKIAAAMAATDRIQVISDYTAARLYATYQVPAKQIFRTYQPIHPRLVALENARPPAGLDRPFFLYPANFWAHKNHEVLLAAYARYRQAAAADAWPLVLTGHADTPRENALRQAAHELGVGTDVHFCGYVSDADLAGYYRCAGALVFPSLHEGFGVPLLEAMAFGTPIVASNASAIPEITGPAALLVDARDPALLAAALQQIASDPDLRTSLAAKGRSQLEKFSADREYRAMLEEFIRTARTPARGQTTGYYPEDGLTDPVAIFSLPLTDGPITLNIRCRTLPAHRTLRLYCGRDLLVEKKIPAGQAADVTVTFQSNMRVLTLRVPDAAPLSVTDPRTHGLLLESLRIKGADGQSHDLLTSASWRPATTIAPDSSKPGYLWHLETPLPTWSSDGCLEIRGWFIRHGGRPVNLRVKVAGIDWPVAANLPRPDVNLVYPRLNDNACGFVVRLRVPAGSHELLIESCDDTDDPVQFVKHKLTVSYFAPLNRVLTPSNHHRVAFQIMVGPYHAPRPIKAERFPRRSKAGGHRPRLAIAIPSFQQRRFLEQTMRSVLGQEAIGDCVVQDGGSTDGSADLVRSIAEEYLGSLNMRLASWESAPDGGQADAIIKGLAKTTGNPDDVMGWINSDDFYLPGALAYVADYFAQHPEVDVVYGNRILVDEASREIGRWFLPDHDSQVLRVNDFVPQETLFWRRRIWQSVGGLDRSFQFAMDWDLLLRFQAAGARIAHVPYFLACFRLHVAQKTAVVFHDVGQSEIERLRIRTLGRSISSEELLNNTRFIQYLRRSALLEMLGRTGLRLA